VVGRAEPLTWTTDPLTKLEPFTVSVKLGPKTRAVAGEILEMVGTGLSTASVKAADVPPPGEGLNTVIERLAPVATSAAVIWAVNWLAFTNVVVRLLPLTRTTEPEMNLLPFNVKVNAALPAVTLVGVILVKVGCGLLTVRVTAVDVPPPGEGLNTVTEMVPAEAMSLAGIAAVSWVLLLNVVLRFEPFTRTTDPDTKLVPFTVSVNAALPAVTVLGEMLASEGAGFVTLTVSWPEEPPPGAALTTVITRLPAEATSPAGIAAVSWVELTKVVVREEPLTWTTDPATKPEPLTVSVKAPLPAVTLAGDTLVSDGAGLFTVNVKVALVPPPGVGVKTVIDNVPAEAMSDAGIVAASCVLLTKVVVRFAPLTRTTEAETKLLPVTVNVNAGLPAVALVGDMLANDGCGLLTASDSVPVVELSGLITPMARLPVEAMSLAGIAAVSCVALTNVVVRFAPFT
jgi:hypothetical protein